jgi:energy-coupling factor transporter ATP-binding protein EcfA2
MAERSREILEVGYYLSRFGYSATPERFGGAKWNEVYKIFYDKLGHGRGILEFEHSLKNTRDGFDGYFPETKREGWKDKDGSTARLSTEAQEVFNEFQNLSEEEVHLKISKHLSILKPMNVGLFDDFLLSCKDTNLHFPENFAKRFISSLLSKPFVILTGLSGSGKTKLAQTFAMWISASKAQYTIVPVGADWTNRDPLLGYPNSINTIHYVKPDSGVLDILIRAHLDYEKNKRDLSKCKPFFLILDEMNLSHVERYFADFLSTMESGDTIKLYSDDKRYSDFDSQNYPIVASLIPQEIFLPKNLFIIGTVNIDETTYMFSSKVLDRANTIEFRISEGEMYSYFNSHSKLDINQLLEDVDANRGKGASFSSEFMRLAAQEVIVVKRKDSQFTFINFFKELQKSGAEFGYRTANEMSKLIAYLTYFNIDVNDAYDIAIMQKLLPKLNGSRSKLNKIILPLLMLCVKDGKVIFPLSYEKLTRMKKNADENGFASFAEA